jgi:hypothetical protein
MVFPNTVVSAYSNNGCEINTDAQTLRFQSTALMVECKTKPASATGLNGITGPDVDYASNPFIGTYAYNNRGEGSNIELFA